MQGSQPQLEQVSVVHCALQAVQQRPSLPPRGWQQHDNQNASCQTSLRATTTLSERQGSGHKFHHVSTAVRDLTLPDSGSQLQTGLQEGKSIYHQHTANPPSPLVVQLSQGLSLCTPPYRAHVGWSVKLKAETLHFLRHQHIDSSHSSL